MKFEVLVSILREELTGEQLDDILNIINGDADITTKKKNVFDRVKEVGIETLSNIISSILSNPQTREIQ